MGERELFQGKYSQYGLSFYRLVPNTDHLCYWSAKVIQLICEE